MTKLYDEDIGQRMYAIETEDAVESHLQHYKITHTRGEQSEGRTDFTSTASWGELGGVGTVIAARIIGRLFVNYGRERANPVSIDGPTDLLTGIAGVADCEEANSGEWAFSVRASFPADYSKAAGMLYIDDIREPKEWDQYHLAGPLLRSAIYAFAGPQWIVGGHICDAPLAQQAAGLSIYVSKGGAAMDWDVARDMRMSDGDGYTFTASTFTQGYELRGCK